MPATGELIRTMNYVDDIAATLRRIITSLPTLSDEEKKQLADYMRKSDPNFIKVLESIEHPKSA
jgi:deoxyribose-phosphate aldolase